MKYPTLAIAALAAATIGPARSQSTTTVSYTPENQVSVNVAETREHLDSLRDIVDQIVVNERLAMAAGDNVHGDAYKRTSAAMTLDATNRVIRLLDGMGTPETVPPSYGDIRMRTTLIDNHLTHARMTSNYLVPMLHIQKQLDKIDRALSRNSRLGS